MNSATLRAFFEPNLALTQFSGTSLVVDGGAK
jgi:hypothetical protein